MKAVEGMIIDAMLDAESGVAARGAYPRSLKVEEDLEEVVFSPFSLTPGYFVLLSCHKRSHLFDYIK